MTDTFAASNINVSSAAAGAVAENSASKKVEKYSILCYRSATPLFRWLSRLWALFARRVPILLVR